MEHKVPRLELKMARRHLVMAGVFVCLFVAFGPGFFAAQQVPVLMDPCPSDGSIVKTTISDLASTPSRCHDRAVTICANIGSILNSSGSRERVDLHARNRS